MTTRKSTGGGDRPLLAPRPVRLPDGALSLGPSPWEPSFRHPFAEGDVALTSKAKQQLRQYRPKLSLDTHVETSPLPHATAAFVASPPALDDETADDVADWGAAISRPPSTASTRANRTPALARRSIDAISLRSFDSASNHAHTAIDVKTLATKAVKEEKRQKRLEGPGGTRQPCSDASSRRTETRVAGSVWEARAWQLPPA